MSNIHDPYLDTVRRSLNEEKIKLRKKKQLENISTKPKSFFSKNITLSDYIYLPESFEKFILLSIFIFIPYMFGISIMFILLDQETFQDYTTFTFDLFMLHWTIGYETIAVLLLLLIIKSAFVFKKNI